MADIPEPYRSIQDLPFDDHGWFTNKEPLEACLKLKPAKVVIEVGSWLGSSTRFIAQALPDDGLVYAVDTWLGSPTEDVHIKDPRLPHLFQLFLSNVKHAQLTHKIIPIRMTSVEAAKALNIQADLIYIDGAHDTDSVVKDILIWSEHLAEKGILCGDDWQWDSVGLAVIKAADLLEKEVRFYQNFWWLRGDNF